MISSDDLSTVLDAMSAKYSAALKTGAAKSYAIFEFQTDLDGKKFKHTVLVTSKTALAHKVLVKRFAKALEDEVDGESWKGIAKGLVQPPKNFLAGTPLDSQERGKEYHLVVTAAKGWQKKLDKASFLLGQVLPLVKSGAGSANRRNFALVLDPNAELEDDGSAVAARDDERRGEKLPDDVAALRERAIQLAKQAKELWSSGFLEPEDDLPERMKSRILEILDLGGPRLAEALQEFLDRGGKDLWERVSARFGHEMEQAKAELANARARLVAAGVDGAAVEQAIAPLDAMRGEARAHHEHKRYAEMFRCLDDIEANARAIDPSEFDDSPEPPGSSEAIRSFADDPELEQKALRALPRMSELARALTQRSLQQGSPDQRARASAAKVATLVDTMVREAIGQGDPKEVLAGLADRVNQLVAVALQSGNSESEPVTGDLPDAARIKDLAARFGKVRANEALWDAALERLSLLQEQLDELEPKLRSFLDSIPSDAAFSSIDPAMLEGGQAMQRDYGRLYAEYASTIERSDAIGELVREQRDQLQAEIRSLVESKRA